MSTQDLAIYSVFGALAAVGIGAALVRLWHRDNTLQYKIVWTVFMVMAPVLGAILYYFWKDRDE